MLNSNTIANKKDASARAKYVGGEDGVFISDFLVYINKFIRLSGFVLIFTPQY